MAYDKEMEEALEYVSVTIDYLMIDTMLWAREYWRKLDAIEARLGIKAGFDPNQPRAPAGNPDGGQWVDGGGSDGGTYSKYPDAIEEVYPEAYVGGFVGVGRALIGRRVGRGFEASLTEHGALRVSQRGITSKVAEEAIRTAKETGNVTTKLGKYGTPQNIYRGSNGTTVIVETAGRNAGKIITVYKH